MSADDIKLLPCPFCGGSNIGERYVEAYSIDSSYNVFGCQDCGAGFVEGSAEDWNRRAPSPQGDAELLERWAKRFGEYAQIAHKHFQRSGGGYDDGRYTAYSQCEMELFAAASAARSTPAKGGE